VPTKCPECDSFNPPDSKFCKECATPLTSAGRARRQHTATLATPIEELPRGFVFAERYEIIEKLGMGGMGEVYKVEDTKVKEIVALKLLKPEVAVQKKTIERFSNELKLARKISHRNICRMYYLGEDKETYYITMEYVPGEDLKSLIIRVKELTAGTAISIAKQICDGLEEAHRVGVIHRDLKPSNIMIDKNGNAKIMDFGIARSKRTKGITGFGVMIGTPEYSSPEQVEGKDIDFRSDIYSLGIILYEMVTGALPFEGDTPIVIGIKQKSQKPPNPQKINPQIPESLCRIILRCMAKDKEERFQSAPELREELETIEKDLPTAERIVARKRPLTSKEITVSFSLKKLLIPVLIIIILAVAGITAWKFIPWKKGESPPVVMAGLPPPEEAAGQVTEPVPEPLAEQGMLKITTDPMGASVWSNDIQLGVTPFEEPLDTGTYDLRIVKLGFEDVSENITIGKDQTSSLSYELQPLVKTFSLLVSTVPRRASVYIDGAYQGESPLRMDIGEGTFRIRLAKDGFHPIDESFDVRSDVDKTFHLSRIGTGWFEINASPYAEIEIDGEPAGMPGEQVPPEKKIQVTEGEHSVAFILKGYGPNDIRAETKESIRAGEVKKLFHEFRNLPSLEGEQKQEDESGKIIHKIGWLRINAFPFARVEIDGQEYREVPSPLKVAVIADKEHEVRLTWKEDKVHEVKISVTEGETKEVFFRFTETWKIEDDMTQGRVLGPGWLMINAMPLAKVEIDGKEYRSVPPPLRVEVLAEIEHIVRLIWRDDKVHEVRVIVEEGETKEIFHVFDETSRKK